MRTYVASPLKVPHNTKNHHEEARGNVVWRCGLQANHDIVTDRRTVSPFDDIWSKAVIREAFSGIEKGVLRKFEVNEVSFGGTARAR